MRIRYLDHNVFIYSLCLFISTLNDKSSLCVFLFTTFALLKCYSLLERENGLILGDLNLKKCFSTMSTSLKLFPPLGDCNWQNLCVCLLINNKYISIGWYLNLITCTRLMCHLNELFFFIFLFRIPKNIFHNVNEVQSYLLSIQHCVTIM